MKLIMEILSENGHGRRVWLSAGQSIEVGRTEFASFVVDSDPHLADVHFRVSCESSAGRLKGLNDLPTFVNGKAVQDCLLQTGDTIQAGRTMLRVVLEGYPVPPPIPASPIVGTTAKSEGPTAEQKPPYQVGEWSFHNEGKGWNRDDGKGLRRPIEKRAPILVLADQGPLPTGVDLDRFVASLDAQAEAAGMQEVEGRPCVVAGATEAWHAVFRKELPNKTWMIQQQIAATCHDRVGVVTVLGPEPDCIEAKDAIQSILDGLEFSPARTRRPSSELN